MIPLSIQINLIIFSFIFGFIFSGILDFFNKNIKNFSKLIKIIISFILIIFSSVIYFIGIQNIGNAIFHIYSIISIMVGFLTYDIIIKSIANTKKKWYTLYGDNMAKRRISRDSKIRLTFLGTISLAAIIYFSFSLIYNVYTIYDLTMEKKKLETAYITLQKESDELKTDIEKLNDPNYLANYAREHYLYSKDGEYIIQIGDIEKVKDNINNEINKNYLIVGLSIFMLFIFIYILSRGKKSKK